MNANDAIAKLNRWEQRRVDNAYHVNRSAYLEDQWSVTLDVGMVVSAVGEGKTLAIATVDAFRQLNAQRAQRK